MLGGTSRTKCDATLFGIALGAPHALRRVVGLGATCARRRIACRLLHLRASVTGRFARYVEPLYANGAAYLEGVQALRTREA